MAIHQTPRILIRRLRIPGEAKACARLMADSEPWITLKRGYRHGLRMLQDKTREVYVAVIRVSGRKGNAKVAGFVILNLLGPLRGYVQTIGIVRKWRNHGIGSNLMAFAEKRIFGECRDVFLFVSSFNKSARRFYRRRGYRQVGELKDYVVTGHSELLMRKTKRQIAN